MKKVFIFLFFIVCWRVEASHIVGGELELVHTGYDDGELVFELRLIYYFDEINGDPENPGSEEIKVMIFRKSDNRQMLGPLILTFIDQFDVGYYQPDCSDDTKIKTSKLIFAYKNLVLDAKNWSDPEGYYVIWERCCRNYDIANIYSVDPGQNQNHPEAAGQTFYLEFPPVTRRGKQFVNSTPQLFPPLTDYACPNKLYFADFAGTDVDGDSLVYSFVDPLSTHTTQSVPPLSPAPYPTVKWREGFSVDNMINGKPDLQISKEGLLTASPTKIGLFVFAVKCEEFRDGEKIGEVRRDFQLLVVDCEASKPPKIKGRRAETNIFQENALSISLTPEDTLRCIEVQISDPDIHTQTIEKVKIRVKPIGFRADILDLLPETRHKVLTVQDSLAQFTLCLGKCPYVPGPFKIAVIAEDDACSLPLLDTLMLTVNIQPPANEKAKFTLPVDDVSAKINEWELDSTSWDVAGVDADGDTLTLSVLHRGFDLEEIGMRYLDTEFSAGSYTGELNWDPNCSIHDFTTQTYFPVILLLDDQDECELEEPDTLVFRLSVGLPSNRKPEIYIDGLTPAELVGGVEKAIFDSLNFKVFAIDSEDDLIKLYAAGDPFSLRNVGISFPTRTTPVSGYGYVENFLDWNILCKDIDINNESDFDIHFIALDNQNKCRFNYADTLILPVKISPPANSAPNFTITNLNAETPYENSAVSAIVGQTISLQFNSVDTDSYPTDEVDIVLLSATGNVNPTGYSFEPVKGAGSAQTLFTWPVDCAVFEGGLYENEYVFSFATRDNRCYSKKGDSVEIAMHLEDILVDSKDFLPPNIVTANGDGCNDFFALEDYTSGMNTANCAVDVEAMPNLPLDNCAAKFSSIRIYNRWGKQVFTSQQRTFRWYPEPGAVGVYFYTIQFSASEFSDRITEFKGAVSVRD